MNFGIYFSAKNDTEGFPLPIMPGEVSVSTGSEGEEYTISKLGNINIPGDVKLEEFKLESYFPLNPTHYSSTAHRKPQYYIDLFKKWMKNKEPVRYIYVDGSFVINEQVTIEYFDFRESDASGDVYFQLSLKKYVSFAPKKMVVVKKPEDKPTVAKKETPPRQNKPPQPKTYVLVKDDSLWKVAQKYTGKGSNYPALANLNNIKPSQYRRLPIGLKLKFPTGW